MAELGAVLLVDEGDAEAVRMYLAGYLLGAIVRGGLPFDVDVEAHTVADRFVPSFEARIGPHTFVVHIDRRIA